MTSGHLAWDTELAFLKCFGVRLNSIFPGITGEYIARASDMACSYSHFMPETASMSYTIAES